MTKRKQTTPKVWREWRGLAPDGSVLGTALTHYEARGMYKDFVEVECRVVTTKANKKERK